jgi:hypothetical protein
LYSLDTVVFLQPTPQWFDNTFHLKNSHSDVYTAFRLSPRTPCQFGWCCDVFANAICLPLHPKAGFVN